jgi:hypothetical protein
MSEIAAKKDGAESGCGEKGKTPTGRRKINRKRIDEVTIL